MKIPFSVDQFFEIFSQYNSFIWPLQIIFYLLALAVFFMVLRHSLLFNKVISGILAFLWVWMGLVYHIFFFTAINPAAYIFGALFIVQGILLFYSGVVNNELKFKYSRNLQTVLGIFFLIYALIIYPLIGIANNEIFPATPILGAPCPTTIFTLGMLLFLSDRIYWRLLIIPVLWTVIAFMAALKLNVIQDFMLPISALVTAALAWSRNRKLSASFFEIKKPVH